MSARMHTILVVDDVFLIREALADYLGECGFKVLQAGDAEEAIGLLQKPDTRIDLVFSDVMMPGALDGVGLAGWIRTNRPDVFVLLTSGYPKKAGMAKDLCPDEPILAKPYRLESVAAKIRSTLNIPFEPDQH